MITVICHEQGVPVRAIINEEQYDEHSSSVLRPVIVLLRKNKSVIKNNKKTAQLNPLCRVWKKKIAFGKFHVPEGIGLVRSFLKGQLRGIKRNCDVSCLAKLFFFS